MLRTQNKHVPEKPTLVISILPTTNKRATLEQIKPSPVELLRTWYLLSKMAVMTKPKSRNRYTPVMILTVVGLTLLFVWGVGDSYLLSTTESDTIQQQHDSGPVPSIPANKEDKNHHMEVAWLMSFGGAVRVVSLLLKFLRICGTHSKYIHRERHIQSPTLKPSQDAPQRRTTEMIMILVSRCTKNGRTVPSFGILAPRHRPSTFSPKHTVEVIAWIVVQERIT